MNVNIYTQNQSIFQNSNSYVFRYFEYILLFIIAATGLLCSAFALTDNATIPPNQFTQQVAAFGMVKKSDFDKYVSMKGDHKTGSVIDFEIKLDITKKRYVMEMGDGRRMILTSPTFNYSYSQPGEYLLELKEIQRGLIVLIGEKKLKIKE